MSADCPACTGQMSPPAQKIAELATSVLYLGGDQFFPGYVLLVLRRHATALYELEEGERRAHLEEVSRVAEAIARVFPPVKMNYELLGNQVPHIHWHLVPRLPADPDLRSPIWRLDHQPLALDPAAARERVERIRRALRAPA